MKKTLIALVGLATALVVYAAPVQTSIDVTDAGDKVFVKDYEKAAEALHELAKKERAFRARAVSYTARADLLLAQRDALAVRVRRRLVTQRPALDAILPAQISDIAVLESGTEMRLKLNAEAENPTWD